MPNRELILKPTFPLDQQEIKVRSRTLKMAHPVSWGSYGLALCLPFITFDGFWAGVFGAVVALGVAGIVVSAFWSGRESQLEARVVEEMIAESNANQDRKLSAIVNHYREKGSHQYAAALGKFLLLKQRIEKSFQTEGSNAAMREQIESLVDTLCAGVCSEFEKVAELDGRLGDVLISGNQESLNQLQTERTAVLDSIMNAYKTLCETHESVTDLEKAGTSVPESIHSPSTAQSNLAKTVDDLRAKIEMTRRIRDRISIPDPPVEDSDFPGSDENLEEEQNT